MYLTSSVLLVVMRYALASEEQNCTELCNVCDKGTCLRCIPGYYGTNCTDECGAHCLDGVCWGRGMCNYGCEDGWYGINCEEPCDQKCQLGKCERFSGFCDSSDPDPNNSSCYNRNCTDNCTEICPPEEETVPPEAVLAIAVVVLVFMVCTCCACCVVKRKVCPGSNSKKRYEVEIVPHRQQLVRGHGPTSFTSVNVVHSFDMPRFEANSEMGDCTGLSGGAAPSACEWEEPPPSYEHVAGAASRHEVEQPPPSYEHACRTSPTDVPS